MENKSERNFLKVTTKVTVRLAHSVVNTNTADMHMYWVTTLAARYSHMLGIESEKLPYDTSVIGSEAEARRKWS